MLIGIFFSYVLIVPLIHGDEKVQNTTRTSTVYSKLHDVYNKTKISIASEGGAIMSNTPALSLLPENNLPALITPDNGSSSNKVKARKGAILTPAEDSENSSVLNQNSSISDDQHIKKENIPNLINNTKVLHKPHPPSPQTNITKIHKPTIVSAEAIAKADEMNSDPAVDDERNIPMHNMNINGNPDMVMPIVITILMVPMIVVIGYMVLKRGREAWKNRHYKRMDFLLDGMYND